MKLEFHLERMLKLLSRITTLKKMIRYRLRDVVSARRICDLPILCAWICFCYFFCCPEAKELKGESVDFSSQFESATHHGREVTEAGAWSSWSHCTHTQEARVTNTRLQLSSPVLIYFRNPACAVTVNVGLPTLINPSQACPETLLLSDFRACQVDNWHEPLQSMYTVYRILVRSEYLMK